MSKSVKLTIGVTIGLVLAVFAAWVWWGTVATLGRGLAASLPLKLLIVGVVVVIVGGFLAMRRSRIRESLYWRSREEAAATKVPAVAPIVATLVTGGVAIVAAFVVMPFTGYWRATVVADSTTVETSEQKQYAWRTPWVTASLAAASKAGNVVGDFLAAETTYLPAIDAYATPVAARGFAAGTGAVAIQHRDGTSETCTFAEGTPRLTGGWFSANLKRAVAFIDPGLDYDPVDAWVYCDNGVGKLVVPVVEYAGILEGVPTPAGVIVFDGANAELFAEVTAGTLPGPVYPSSIAAGQRDSLTSTGGVWDKVFNRAGYETSEDVDGDPNSGNVAELLLERADSSGWDFVTPLSPRGKSFTITAVAAVAADTVKAGTFNPLVVHLLDTPREGNLAVADRVKAAFPQLGWASGLSLVEVVPTSATTWEAALTNGRVVANRVSLGSDGSLCLQTPGGDTIECVTADGGAQPPSDTTGSGGSIPAPGSLDQLSDEELAKLALDVAAEQLRRAQTTSE